MTLVSPPELAPASPVRGSSPPIARRRRIALAADTSLSVVFENVGKVYRSSSGPVHALHDIDLSIPRGSIFGIIGRSGAGKSSLLRTINGLEAPSAGRVVVDGQDVAALDKAGLIALRRRVGMVFPALQSAVGQDGLGQHRASARRGRARRRPRSPDASPKSSR